MDEYIKHYDIATKTQTILVDDKVIHSVTFDHCPYIWFGELKDEIESGDVVFVAWKMLGKPVEMSA